MTLATSTRVGEPSARMVLLRGVDERGFGFFTNYDSQKGRDLAQNPRAALIMYWPKLGRQVRVAGAVVKQSPEESIAYFHNRPLASQLSAWASPQSSVIRNRAVLEDAVAALAAKYEGTLVPLPPNWGGYRVRPRQTGAAIGCVRRRSSSGPIATTVSTTGSATRATQNAAGASNGWLRKER